MRISDWSSDVCSSDLADADEASLDAATSAAALEQQRAFLDARVAACANIRTTAQLEDFVVVAELDASGRVTNTWRLGDTLMALRIERDASGIGRPSSRETGRSEEERVVVSESLNKNKNKPQ